MNHCHQPVSPPLLGPTIRRLTVPALLLVLGVSWAWAQTPATPAPAETVKLSSPEALALDRRLLDEARKDSQIIPNLTYLCDVIGPRLTGSPALKRANDWTADKLRSYGLSNVHLEPWTIPMAWERGTATARILEPENGRTLTVAASGWSPSTKGLVEGDVVIVTARNSKDLEAYKGKLKNAIVLRSPPTPVRPITDTKMTPPGVFQGKRSGNAPSKSDKDGKDSKDAKETKEKGGRGRRDFSGDFGFRNEVSNFLRAEGAAVILSDAAKPHSLLNMGGGWRGQERADAAEPIPTLFMIHEDYALLYRLASRPPPARTRVAVEVRNKLIPGPVPVYNTVGEIPGKEKPQECVILGAHLDSWDLGQGATDNGTGSMVVLEAARILSKCGVTPRRTIRFVLFTGEEQGLYGSRAYVTKHKDELARISMVLVHDTGTGKVTGIGLQGRKNLIPLMQSELVSLKEVGCATINERTMGGTDHLSFDREGVPAFACQQDMDEYRFTHHSQSDTLDKAREPNLIQGAQVMAVAAMRVANLDLMLPREK